MTSRADRSFRGGLTLVELLAVLILLTLAAGMLAGVAGPMRAAQARPAAIAAVRSAVERAALLAERAPERTPGGGTVELVFPDAGDQRSTVTVLRAVRTVASPLPEQSTALPRGWTASLSTRRAGDPAMRSSALLRFYRDGTSDDAVIALSCAGTPGESAARIEVLGLSGQVRVDDPEPMRPSGGGL